MAFEVRAFKVEAAMKLKKFWFYCVTQLKYCITFGWFTFLLWDSIFGNVILSFQKAPSGQFKTGFLRSSFWVTLFWSLLAYALFEERFNRHEYALYQNPFINIFFCAEIAKMWISYHNWVFIFLLRVTFVFYVLNRISIFLVLQMLLGEGIVLG